MPFQSTSQQRFAFGTGQPWAKRWAKQTNFKRLPYKKAKKDIVSATPMASGYATGPGGLMSAPGMGATLRKRTPRKKRTKAFTIEQLEGFVVSNHYDPVTAAAIAAGIPELPRLKGEQLAPGVTRIHGNLCNVHGKYGRCPGSAVTPPPKPRRTRHPRTPRKSARPRVDRAALHAKNRTATLTSAGYSAADQAALGALRTGQQPAEVSQGLIDKGLVERANDGSYRMTASGRALMGAADQGDAGRVRDTVSSAADRLSARQARQAAAAKRQQDAAGKHAAAQAGRELARNARLAKQQAAAAAKKPAKAGGGRSKRPAKAATPTPPKATHVARTSIPHAPALAANTPPKAASAPAKQIAPALVDAAQNLSDGKPMSDSDTQALIRNGLARLVKGQLVLTSAGMRATKKEHTIARWNGRAWVANGVVVAEPDQSQFAGYTMEDYNDEPKRKPSPKDVEAARRQFATALGIDTVAQPSSFKVFKDARGQMRWVAQSSTAYQDRDQEIVSTKALTEDCAFADTHHSYGPLRWWHTPGLDLGDCDFNAMHGRVLIESGTFRSPEIAQKVASASARLEISLGFLHLPTEPDASGVFHHIRRFERSLVPRGKASNRFTAFRVKERSMFDPTKVAALKQLGFSDADITNLQTQAEATEKTASEQGVAYKADEPELPDMIINGVTYKAFPPKAAAPDAEDATEAPETPGEAPDAEDMAEAPEEEAGGLTLSPEDIDAIGQAVSTAIQGVASQIMGALDLEKKVAGHVQGLMAPYAATKDASDAEKAEQITQLQASLKSTQDKLDELLGLQPAVTPRASAAPATALNLFNPADAALLESVKDQIPRDQQIQRGNGFEDLTKNLFGV